MTIQDFKSAGIFDIISPDLRYLRSPQRQTSDYDSYKDEMNALEFMQHGETFTEGFHSFGLLVHVYTLKDDFMKYSTSSPIDEYEYLFNQLQVDGVFSENPKTAILARDYFNH